jgi:hypothetical protein
VWMPARIWVSSSLSWSRIWWAIVTVNLAILVVWSCSGRPEPATRRGLVVTPRSGLDRAAPTRTRCGGTQRNATAIPLTTGAPGRRPERRRSPVCAAKRDRTDTDDRF